jgi:hypothetical protein
MKIMMGCIECAQSSLTSTLEDVAVYIDVGDKSFGEGTCSRGHVATYVLQQQRFETLLNFGALSLLDGYYREAITNFATSLERFYEFYIRVVCLQHGLSQEEYEAAWKQTAASSERQLGAFTFIHLMHTGKPGSILGQKDVELRNRVVHKGSLSSEVEALSFGQAVYTLMSMMMEELKRTAPEALHSELSAQVRRSVDAAQAIGKVHAIGHVGLIDSLAGAMQPSFEDGLEKLKVSRPFLFKR